jgi:hypothetical protein
MEVSWDLMGFCDLVGGYNHLYYIPIAVYGLHTHGATAATGIFLSCFNDIYRDLMGYSWDLVGYITIQHLYNHSCRIT